MADPVEAIRQQLFPGEGIHTFVILDGAAIPDLLEKLDAEQPPRECLHPGELAPEMAKVVPYLVELEPDAPLAEWVIQQGWGKHWGVFVLSRAELFDIRLHFRQFVIVHDPSGRPMFFRFYDPRVLATYLPTCNAGELECFFGPVTAYVMEGAEPTTLLRFAFDDGKLNRKQEKIGPA